MLQQHGAVPQLARAKGQAPSTNKKPQTQKASLRYTRFSCIMSFHLSSCRVAQRLGRTTCRLPR